MAGGAGEKQPAQVVLTEGAILGGGAFSRVSIVTGVHMVTGMLLFCLLFGFSAHAEAHVLLNVRCTACRLPHLICQLIRSNLTCLS